MVDAGRTALHPSGKSVMLGRMKVIRVHNISKSFGKLRAVADLSFEVEEGTCYRPARAERGRQDDDDEDDLRPQQPG